MSVMLSKQTRSLHTALKSPLRLRASASCQGYSKSYPMTSARPVTTAMRKSSPSIHDQIILFGASILEQSSTQERGFALAPALQQAYIRRLDVVNRGFSGYNTELALKVLPKIMPDPQQAKVRFMVILFGSNDACFAEARNGQHVPLDAYKKNLVDIVTHPTVEAHKPRLILVTPPPVEERRLEHRVKSQGYTKLNRSNERTKQYADASRQVALDMNISCVDLWGVYMAKAGWREGQPLCGAKDLPENAVLRGFIHDGLHLTPVAYQLFYYEILKVIAEKWPDQTPDLLPYVIPAWDDTQAWAREGIQMGSPRVTRHE